ncbi:MAG: signal peptidase I [Nitrospiraceae bacterium]|nr:signal peptidase I [Nitrospiraceae bacterium]
MTSPGQKRAFTRSKSGQLVILAIALVLLYLFAYRNMRFFLVPSRSMEPTLYTEDYILTLKERTYEPGDIVVLDDPEDEGGYVVKRIVALGPADVSIQGGCVYVNGRYISEPYILERPEYEMEPAHIAEGKIFLLGDNRNNSDDSSLWDVKGQPIDHIVGRVRFIYAPFKRAGLVRTYRLPASSLPDSRRLAAATRAAATPGPP